MKNKLVSWLACGLLVLVTGCKPKPSAAPASPTITIQQEWFPFAGFAGEVSGAKRFASRHELKVNVLPGSEQIDPIKLVLSKSSPVGVVSGDLLVSAVAKGAPLVAIAVVNERSPTVFIVDDKSSIKSPADFPGHKVGLLAGTNTERIYALMMKRSGVDRSNVKEIQIPFDLQTFLMGAYEVRPAFIYDETVSLQQQGRTFRLIKPEDFGVHFVGTVYFTSRDYLASHRSDIVKLLATLNDGWKFALANPADAISDLKESFPDLQADREIRALEMGRAYFANAHSQPLVSTRENWQKMIAGLEELGVIQKNTITPENVWDPAPLDEALKK
jgi:ABC-type nitrate/sulfonate/bicarbonate transport system substrate-binding protein